MNKKVYFIRHGQSVANANNIISPPDTPLTDLGIEQAKKVAQKLANLGVKTVISSNMPRAYQTAHVIAKSLKIHTTDIKVVPLLAERDFGTATNHPKRHNTDFFYTNDSDLDMEPRQALIQRMTIALKQIKPIIKASAGNVVIVGHGNSGFFLSQIAKGNLKYADFEPINHIRNCGMIEIDIQA